MVILYILIAILMFGFLIFIHELGHFMFAKKFGVEILEFSIGMGPKIFSKKGVDILFSLMYTNQVAWLTGENPNNGSLVKRLRRRPLTAETGVRFP